MKIGKKNFSRVLAVVLCLMMASMGTVFADTDAVTVTATDTAAATDEAATAAVEKDWVDRPYTEAVESLMSRGIITGDVDGLFHPEQHLTRAQACKIVIATVGVSEELLASSSALSAGTFTDLSGAKWAAPYIGYAHAAGIIKGYEDGSFRPSNNVTVAELCAMLVRASGAEDKVSGTWPTNYTNLATDMGLLKGTGIAGLEDYVSKQVANSAAEKWMAAWLTYNGSEGIRGNAAAMNKTVEEALTPAETGDAGTDDVILQDIDMGSYGKIKDAVYCPGNYFSSDFKQFAGVDLADNIKVYTCGVEKDYNKKMTMPSGASNYHLTSLYKYKNVSTKAWCGVTGDKISTIILPANVGFTGKVYGVVNGIVQTLNADGNAVYALEVLAAGHETTWAAHTASVVLPSSDELKDAASKGAIYEISVTSGEITSLTSDPAMKLGKEFKIITGSDWVEVTSKPDKKNLIGLDSGTGSRVYEINPDAIVYVLAGDGESFEVGSISSIGTGDYVRLYDFTKDDYEIANIIVVRDR